MIHGGVEPDLLGEVIWWSSDDLWRWSFYELVIYLRIAAERSGRPLAASRSPVGLRSQTEGSSLIPATVGVEAPIPATSRMGVLRTSPFDAGLRLRRANRVPIDGKGQRGTDSTRSRRPIERRLPGAPRQAAARPRN